MKITLGGKEYDVSDELGAAITAAIGEKQKTADDATAKASESAESAKESEAKADKAEARADGLKAELAKAKDEAAARTDSATTPARVRAAVKERRRIEKVAERTLKKDDLAKLDSMDDAELKKAIIKAEQPTAALDGKSEAYVDARFDSIAETIEADAQRSAKFGKELGEHRKDRADDGKTPDADASRKAMLDREGNRWKPAVAK